MKKAYLLLSNGEVFEGERFGAEHDVVGEILFNTDVVGYIENLTDPCFEGKIVVQTFPLIGNYGMIPEDANTAPRLAAYVVRECCEEPSNFRAQGTLGDWLKANGIPGLSGVDTRAVTHIIREEGVMAAGIFSEIPVDLNPGTFVPKPKAPAKTVPVAYSPLSGQNQLLLLDFGAPRDIKAEFEGLGYSVDLLAPTATAAEILARQPMGVILSDGPGAPEAYESAVAEIRKLLGQVPLLAFGLGHLLLAVAAGGRVEKLLYGHHGSNQPIRNLKTGRVYTTHLNSDFHVVAESLGAAELRYQNLNDLSAEGFDYPMYKAMSLSFRPTSDGGPQDLTAIYREFIELCGGQH